MAQKIYQLGRVAGPHPLHTIRKMSDHRWNKPGVPHNGWLPEAVEDIEEAVHICEMCGKEGIRYVHTIYHGEAEMRLDVGCQCAAKMCADYDGAAAEERLRRRASRRCKFPNLKSWYVKPNGNHCYRRSGWIITIFQGQYGGWGFFVAGQRSNEFYDSIEAAKLAAFDNLDPRKHPSDY